MTVVKFHTTRILNIWIGVMDRVDFEDALKLKSLVKLTVDDDNGGDTYRGIVVGLSDRFLALIVINEFHSDGLNIIPLERIEKLVCGHSERTSKLISVFNGLKLDDNLAWLDLSSFPSLFASIHKHGKSMFVASNDTGEAGFMLSTNEYSLAMKASSPSGDWGDEPAIIRYDTIYAVSVDDRYSRVLCSYASNKSQA